MLLLLARHGETEGNRENRFQGHRDYPLTCKGREQALSLQPVLEDFKIQAVFASDLDRARQTALLAARHLEAPFYFHPLFREYSFGVMEGLTLQEVQELYPGLAQSYRDSCRAPIPPGAEEIACFTRRLRASRDFFAGFPRGCRCLLVGHGRFINAFLTLIISGQEAPPYRFPVSNASLSALRLEGGKGELMFFNDICHLEKT